MKNAVLGSSSQIACQVDLGNGQQLDLDFLGDNELWVTTGYGIEVVNHWVSALAPGLDLRIKLVRSPTGLEVVVDRGEQDSPWWPAEDCPRLIIAVDRKEDKLSVSARVGHSGDRREALLGAISLSKGED